MGKIWMMDETCVHRYDNHKDIVAEQLARTPRGFQTLHIAPQSTLFDHQIENFSVERYDPYPPITASVAV